MIDNKLKYGGPNGQLRTASSKAEIRERVRQASGVAMGSNLLGCGSHSVRPDILFLYAWRKLLSLKGRHAKK